MMNLETVYKMYPFNYDTSMRVNTLTTLHCPTAEVGPLGQFVSGGDSNGTPTKHNSTEEDLLQAGSQSHFRKD